MLCLDCLNADRMMGCRSTRFSSLFSNISFATTFTVLSPTRSTQASRTRKYVGNNLEREAQMMWSFQIGAELYLASRSFCNDGCAYKLSGGERPRQPFSSAAYTIVRRLPMLPMNTTEGRFAGGALVQDQRGVQQDELVVGIRVGARSRRLQVTRLSLATSA